MSEEPSTIIRPAGGITYEPSERAAIRRAMDEGGMIIAGARIEGDFRIVIPDDDGSAFATVVRNWLTGPEREEES